MNKLYIKDFESLANEMLEKISKGKYDASFIGNYNDSSALIKSLLRLDNVTPYQITLEPDEWDGYDKEFLVTLDEDLCLWCEKAYREKNGYFTFDSDCMYLADDCNEEVLDHVEADEIWKVSYGDVDEECLDDECLGDECSIDDCCGKCCCFGRCTDDPEDTTELNIQLSENASEYHNVSRTKDGRVTGFTKSWTSEKNGMTEYSSFSYMGNNEVAVRRLAADFGIKID